MIKIYNSNHVLLMLQTNSTRARIFFHACVLISQFHLVISGWSTHLELELVIIKIPIESTSLVLLVEPENSFHNPESGEVFLLYGFAVEDERYITRVDS